jgi:hypothetical protein
VQIFDGLDEMGLPEDEIDVVGLGDVYDLQFHVCLHHDVPTLYVQC